MSRAPGQNRKLARPSKIVEAPPDPMLGAHGGSDEESPPPAPTSATLRPPPGPSAHPAKRPLGKLARSLQLVLGVAVVLIASIAVAWGARRYIMSSPRF